MPHKPSHPKGCLGDLGDCPPTFIFSPMRCRHGADPVAMAFLVLGYSASRMRRVTPPLRRPCAWLGGLSDEIARLVPKRCVRTDQAHGREGVVEDNGLTKGAKTSEFWVAAVPVALAMLENFKQDTESSERMMTMAFAIGGLYLASRTALKMMEMWAATKRQS